MLFTVCTGEVTNAFQRLFIPVFQEEEDVILALWVGLGGLCS